MIEADVQLAVQVKVCGVRDATTAAAAARFGADFIGVVLVPSSPRFVAPAAARALAVAIADAGAIPVAVVRLPIDDETRASLEAFPIVQFHGSESIDLLSAYRAWECWKGLHFSPTAASDWLASGAASRLVVDGADAGSGERWDLAPFAGLAPALRARCLLAGGLDASNVADAVRTARPFGVDVSSGVEIARGIKDHARIAAFIEAAKSA